MMEAISLKFLLHNSFHLYTVFHRYPDSYSTMRVRILVEHSVQGASYHPYQYNFKSLEIGESSLCMDSYRLDQKSSKIYCETNSIFILDLFFVMHAGLSKAVLRKNWGSAVPMLKYIYLKIFVNSSGCLYFCIES